MLRLAADAASIVLSAEFVGWGIWLLLAPDPDGGRHPAGVLLVTVGAVAGVACASACVHPTTALSTSFESRRANSARVSSEETTTTSAPVRRSRASSSSATPRKCLKTRFSMCRW